MSRQIIAVDWDHTLFDSAAGEPLPGALDALWAFREAGHRVMVHSCNNPAYIREQVEKFGMCVDYVWGETGQEASKPVAACYLDDRGIQFKGNWAESANEVLAFVSKRSISR